MKKITLFLAFLAISQLAISQTLKYPITKTVEQKDTFYSEYVIEDKYRWLENTSSPEVRDWMHDQNKIAKRFLARTSMKTNSFKLVDRYSYAEYRNSRKEGKYYFFYASSNSTGVPALCYKRSLNFDGEVLVDPNYISKKDKVDIKGYFVSKDSKLLAYQFDRNGSDWAELKVVSLDDARHKKDHLKNLKFSNIAWKDDGFFYSTFEQDSKFGRTQKQIVKYHKVGTEQSEDIVVFKRNNSSLQFFFQTTSNERFFILKERDETRGVINVFYIDYESKIKSLRPLYSKLRYDIGFRDSHNGKLIAVTNYKANNRYVIEIDPSKPMNWRVVIPEEPKALLLETSLFDHGIVAHYQSNGRPIVCVYNYEGKKLYNLELAVATSVRGFSGNKSDEEVLFNFEAYTIPPVVYTFNVKTFKKKLTQLTTVAFDFSKVEYKEVEYEAEDGTLVPLVLVYEKGLKLDGTNPTILKAYGGFGAVAQPSFDPGVVYFIKKGGVFAFANIRGGGDYGADWARQGRGLRKQTSIDDFVSAAEYLIESGYTNADKLGITGGSNGGLVVAAAAIQRPELFKVAVPIVAPLDMLRFEKFTVGHWHTDEYGTVNDSLSFTKLKNYSPYHNIKEGVNYPSMLIMTSENDDRVPPLHSYKFAARLQNRDAQKNPILLRIKRNAGHYGANTVVGMVRESADIYGFIKRMIDKEE